jgi:enediyne biosynthesis protein E4
MKTNLLSVNLLLATALTGMAQANFTRVTNTVLTAELASGLGAAWADYDGDGWLDLAQANFLGPHRLFHNNGNGTFSRITNSVAVAGPESAGMSWGDFNNDGRPDLFFGNGYDSGIANQLFQNQTLTNGGFLPLTTGPGSMTSITASSGCSWGDYDRDGFLDLFVSNSGSKSELWHNKGDGTFERELTGPVVNNVADSIGAAWADYDNDGWPDLFVANGFGSASPQKNFLYHNNGDGTFTQIKTGSIVNDLAHFCGAAWGDYDNDGFLDLFVTNLEGHNYLYHNNRDGSFSRITVGPIVQDTTGGFISAAWADYDNDGWLDLFVGNRTEGHGNSLYHNNGDGTFTKITAGPIVEDQFTNGGCAWGDYDNDGFPDLFVSGFDITENNLGQSMLYHNTGTTNHWLKVLLFPSESNGSAIGAKIRVTAVIHGQTVTQMREVSSGDGFGGSSPEAIFGLGDARLAANVSVEWPSGHPHALVLDHPASGLSERVSVYEPVALKVLALNRAGGSITFQAIPPRGRVLGLESSTNLATWSNEPVSSWEARRITIQTPPGAQMRFYRALFQTF